jgi:spore maturation protein CgeB
VKFVLFYHPLVSDWNHGHAHFLRGIVRELTARGHEVALYEPADGWRANALRADAPVKPGHDQQKHLPFASVHWRRAASGT